MASLTQKSKNSYQKEKIFDIKTIKNFKKGQKSDKKNDKKATGCRFLNFLLSLFIAPKKCDKKTTKCDKLSFSFLSVPTPGLRDMVSDRVAFSDRQIRANRGTFG